MRVPCNRPHLIPQRPILVFFSVHHTRRRRNVGTDEPFIYWRLGCQYRILIFASSVMDRGISPGICGMSQRFSDQRSFGGLGRIRQSSRLWFHPSFVPYHATKVVSVAKKRPLYVFVYLSRFFSVTVRRSLVCTGANVLKVSTVSFVIVVPLASRVPLVVEVRKWIRPLIPLRYTHLQKY